MHIGNRKTSIVYWLDNKLYLNVTNKCSNNCYFCFRKFKTGILDFNLKLKKEPTIEEVIKEIRKFINKKNWSEIVFCGFGEPLEKLNLVLEVTEWIKKNYLKTVRVDTNGQGYLLNKGRNVLQELKQASLDKMNISLNAQNKEVYNRICKPFYENAYESILDFIKKSAEEGIQTVVTAVSIPEIDILKVKKIVENMNVKFVIREYVPFFW